MEERIYNKTDLSNDCQVTGLNIPDFIAYHPHLSNHAKVLYGLLYEKSRSSPKDFFVYPQAQIAEKMGCSCRTIKRYLRELRELKDEKGNPQPILLTLRTAGGRNVYKLLPIPAEFGLPSSEDTSGPRIRGGVGGTLSKPRASSSLSLEKPTKDAVIQAGKKLLNSPEGQALISRLLLLYYDWNVSDPSLTERHRRNRQRQNRRDVERFVGQYGLAGLEFAIVKTERTNLKDGAAILRKMLQGKLYKSEKEKLAKLAKVA